MATTKAKRHAHKYFYTAMNPSTKVWACALPDCNHYMPPNMMNMVEGKMSECWECDNKTIMTAERMDYAKKKNDGRILCEDCINRHENVFAPSPTPVRAKEISRQEATEKVKSILDEIE